MTRVNTITMVFPKDIIFADGTLGKRAGEHEVLATSENFWRVRGAYVKGEKPATSVKEGVKPVAGFEPAPVTTGLKDKVEATETKEVEEETTEPETTEPETKEVEEEKPAKKGGSKSGKKTGNK